MEDALWTQGIRKKSKLKRNRYEFQTDHGFRKWFKTRCEISVSFPSLHISLSGGVGQVCVFGSQSGWSALHSPSSGTQVCVSEFRQGVLNYIHHRLCRIH